MDGLVLNKEALEKMGLYAKVIFFVEYDMHSEWKIPEDSSHEEAKWLAQRNKLARRFRNDLVYLLKYNLYATRHLQSCWIVEGKYLDVAKTELKELIKKMEERGFHDASRRIRIVRIVTTPEDNEYYETKKANFLLNFINEALGYCDRAEKKGKLEKGTLWRIEKAYEIVSIMKEEVQGHKLYGEIEKDLAKLRERTEEVKPLKDLEDGEEDD